MKESVLDVLIYLFENYMDGEMGNDPDQDTLETELVAAGFTRAEINKAFSWLEDLGGRRGREQIAVPADHSIRIYTEQEMTRLDGECRGFLLFLEQSAILTPNSRELVVDRVMALEGDEIGLEQLKWVILLVLFNQPGQEEAYAWMEDLIFDTMIGHVH